MNAKSDEYYREIVYKNNYNHELNKINKDIEDFLNTTILNY